MVHPHLRISQCVFSHLNTSYVMVHQIDLLGTYDVAVFKYILCYGSSMLWDWGWDWSAHLNTSYVMVHLGRKKRCCGCSIYLNTSYVMVHLLWKLTKRDKILFKYILCYGSSRSAILTFFFCSSFKYILCYGSSNADFVGQILPVVFKYILCYGSSCFNFSSSAQEFLI